MIRFVRLKDADESFDIEFWNKVGVQGILEAAWDMVVDLKNWNPKYAPEPGLRKFHTLFKHR